MSVRESVFQLCKAIRASECRDPIRDLIRKLDKTDFGYIAGKQGVQFLGYLMVDQERDRLLESPSPIRPQPLPTDDRHLLEEAHSRVALLNKQCVEPLTNALPKLASVVDPYSQFRYAASLPPVEANASCIDATSAVAASFHTHPAIGIALNNIPPAMNKIPEPEYTALVRSLTERLLKEGVSAAPNDIVDIAMSQGPRSKRRLAARHLYALVCLRASLDSLNQLMFQATLDDKLPVLSEDNIIRVRGPAQHLVGEGLSVTYQPSERVDLVRPGEFLLVKCLALPTQVDAFCRVEQTQLQFFRGFGNTVDVELRVTDENLNPFGSLLGNI